MTVGGGAGMGAVTALSLTTLVVVVVVLFPGTFPFSSVIVVFFTLIVTVLMFMPPALPPPPPLDGLMGVVEALVSTWRPELGVRPAGVLAPFLASLPGRSGVVVVVVDADGLIIVLALFPRGATAPPEGGVLPVFVFPGGEFVFFSGVFKGVVAALLGDLSTFRLTEDLCCTTGGGENTSSGAGAGCVGDRGTDVLHPTDFMGDAPGIRI
jgi:hypothetical protein